MKCPAPEVWPRVVLDPESDAHALEHAASCSACGARLAEERALSETLNRYYRERDAAIDFEAGQSRLEGALAALPSRVPRPAWRRPVAAAVLVALVGVLYWVPWGNPLVMAEVLEKLDAATSVHFRLWSPRSEVREPESLPGTRSEVWMAAGRGGRSDFFEDGELVETTLLNENGWATFIDHRARVCHQQVDPGDGRKNFFDSELDPAITLSILRDLLERFDRRLGRQEVAGRMAEGFETGGATEGRIREDYLPEGFRRQMLAMRRMLGQPEDEAREVYAPRNDSVRIWIDIETRLPVRVEEHGIDGRSQPSIRVRDRFVWNEAVPDDLFALPADYSVERETVEPVPQGTIDDLIESLRLYAELEGGAYPKRLAGISGQLREALGRAEGLTAREILEADVGALTDPRQADRLRRCRDHAEPAFFFLVDLYGQDDRVPEYFGAEVGAGDEAVLLRWQTEAGEWQALHGDLRVTKGD